MCCFLLKEKLIGEYCLLKHSSIEDVSDEILDWIIELLESGLCIETIISIILLLFAANVALALLCKLVDWLKKNSVKNKDKTKKKVVHIAAVLIRDPSEISVVLGYSQLRSCPAIIDLNDPSGSNLEELFRDNPLYIKVEVRHPDLEGITYKGFSTGVFCHPGIFFYPGTTEIANSQGPWDANEIRALSELAHVNFPAGTSLDKIISSLNNQTDYILQTGYLWSPLPLEISFNHSYYFKTLTTVKIYQTYISEARFI